VTILAAHLQLSGNADASRIKNLPGFDPGETHGIFARPGCTLHASSAALGWHNLFVSTVTETPWKASYSGVRHHLLVLQLNGPAHLSLEIAGRSTTKQVIAGGCTLCPGGEGFSVQIADTVDSTHIYLRDELLQRAIAERAGVISSSPRVQPFFGMHEPLIEQLGLACVSALNGNSESCSLYVDHLAWALAAHLVELNAKESASRSFSRLKGLTERQLRRVENYMREHLYCDIAVDDLAAAAGLSSVYFGRQFKLRTGSTPHRYLRSIRIERAKTLLLNDSIPIAEVAIMCGFCHQEHMTRAFRMECGTTPAAFRRGRIK
jgi:AraC family transcriptional regulator